MTVSPSTKHGKWQTVEFLSNGLKIRGVLRLPQGQGPFPIVIAGHGFGALKEWTLPYLVDTLVEAGIAGLYFDYRNFGDSEGAPREEVAHHGRVEDWRSAISFATNIAEVDPQQIGIWGTSLGGKDVLVVASLDPRVKVVVTQTPAIKFFPERAARMAGFGDDLTRFWQELAEDHKNRTLGGNPRYVPWVRQSGEDSKIAFLDTLNDAERRNYKGRVTIQSYYPTSLVDITPLFDLLRPIPILFILAEDDHLSGQREAYEAIKEPKSLVFIKGDHWAPYSTSKEAATRAAKEWFVKHLS